MASGTRRLRGALADREGETGSHEEGPRRVLEGGDRTIGVREGGLQMGETVRCRRPACRFPKNAIRARERTTPEPPRRKRRYNESPEESAVNLFFNVRNGSAQDGRGGFDCDAIVGAGLEGQAGIAEIWHVVASWF